MKDEGRVVDEDRGPGLLRLPLVLFTWLLDRSAYLHGLPLLVSPFLLHPDACKVQVCFLATASLFVGWRPSSVTITHGPLGSEGCPSRLLHL